MKIKTILPILAAFALLISAATTPAQPAPGFSGTAGVSAPGPVGAIDPATGLPIAPTVVPWKDENWKDPSKVLKEVDYDGLPISEVAHDLANQFTNSFDVLLPHDWEPSPGEEP